MDHNSLEINTLNPLPGWPRLRQAAISVGRPGSYWFHAEEQAGRLENRLAVIQLGLRGRGRVVVDGQQLWVDPGQVMIMRTGQDSLEYGLNPDDAPWHIAYVEIAGVQALTALGELIQRYGHVYQPGPTDFLQIIQGLANRPGIHHAVWDMATSARAAGALLASVAHTTQTGEDALTSRAITLFEERLGQPVTIEEIAGTLGVSRERLTRAFRESLGVPPATWLRHRRLDLARQLLLGTGAQVQEVAGRVGYRSVAQFLRAYVERHGQTPGGRRRHQGADHRAMIGDRVPIPPQRPLDSDLRVGPTSGR